MSKGVASRNSLKALAHPLRQFLANWGAHERPFRATATDADLPAPYELAALRGEGILRERFFGRFIPKLRAELDAEQQIVLWKTLVEGGGYVTAWVQRLGIAQAVRREAVVAVDLDRESRKLYCLLLDALRDAPDDLMGRAVEGYFMHCWRERFPKEAIAKPTTTQAEVLRERLRRALRRRHTEPVEIKESFKEENDVVRFALLTKRESVGRWETLVELERPRLRSARLAAYEESLVVVADG
jgi:hypothetical protein